MVEWPFSCCWHSLSANITVHMVILFPSSLAEHRHTALKAAIFAYAGNLENTHRYADCLLIIRLPYIPWFQLTTVDVSQLSQRPNLNKGKLSQVGHTSSWRHQSLFPQKALQKSVCVKYLVLFSVMSLLLSGDVLYIRISTPQYLCTVFVFSTSLWRG